jgi:uncharacterized protein
MKSRVEIRLREGAYLMDIANKIIVPQPSEEDVLDETGDYFKKRDELLQKHDVEDYADFVTKRIEKRITPQMIERQLANMVQLVFEVTEDCNLNCGYCGYGEFYGDFTARHKSYMPFEIAKTILDYLLPYWESDKHSSFKREINISFYGGEPLMNMNLIQKIIDYTEQLEFKYSRPIYSMTTNAMLLDRYMDYLVEKKIACY